MSAQRISVPRRLGRLTAGLAALAALAGLLVGAPLALLAFAGNPLPDHVPGLSEVGRALTSRDDGQLFLRALAVLGWAGWATFALSVLVEIPARLLRLPVPRLPGLRTQQRMAATLVGSTMALLTVGTAATAASSTAAGYATSVPAVAGHPGAGPADRTGFASAVGWAPTAGAGAPAGPVAPAGTGVAADQAAPAPTASTADAGTARGPVYRVQRGDYLGGIADRYLGDFERFRELARINRLRNPDLILPGQRVRLPADALDTGRQPHATGSARPVRPAPPSGRLPSDASDASDAPADQGSTRAGSDAAERSGGSDAAGPKRSGSARPGAERAGGSGPGAGESTGSREGAAKPERQSGAPGRTDGRSGPTRDPAGSTADREPAANDKSGPGRVKPDGSPAKPGADTSARPPDTEEVPSGPFDPEVFAPSPAVAGAAETGGQGAAQGPPERAERGWLALAVAAVVAAASVVGAQAGVLLGLKSRRPHPSADNSPQGRHRQP